jgi:hypothetical protein
MRLRPWRASTIRPLSTRNSSEQINAITQNGSDDPLASISEFLYAPYFSREPNLARAEVEKGNKGDLARARVPRSVPEPALGLAAAGLGTFA